MMMLGGVAARVKTGAKSARRQKRRIRRDDFMGRGERAGRRRRPGVEVAAESARS
jgi:hypothetical protein